MKPTDAQRFAELESWAKEQGASLHPAVEIYQDEVTKFSLRVRPEIGGAGGEPVLSPGDLVVSCPVSTTLSYLNALTGRPLLSADIAARTDSGGGGDGTTSASAATKAPAFPDSFMEELPPHVIGRFFLVQQYLLGRDSHWWAYIATLPQPEHVGSWALPAFWTEDDAALLDGTNLAVAIEEIQGNVKGEFKRARKLLKEAGFPGWQDYTRLLYNWAFCIFTSRSFRPSLVLSAPARAAIETGEGGWLRPGCDIDSFSVLQPLVDIANHLHSAQTTWDVESDPACCQVRTRDTYRAGQQIFNNYGPKTNSELLLGYGFMIPEAEGMHNDYVHVRKRKGKDSSEGGSHYGDAEIVDQTGVKPQDFLISLRPMNDRSSPVGRYRQTVATSPDFAIRPEFAHIEDALIWDMAKAILASQWQPEAAAALVDRYGSERECLRRILLLADEEGDPELEDLILDIKEVLLAKLLLDYQRLVEADAEMGLEPGADEDLELAEGLNGNQRMAWQYRRQAGRTLTNALTALDPEWAAR